MRIGVVLSRTDINNALNIANYSNIPNGFDDVLGLIFYVSNEGTGDNRSQKLNIEPILVSSDIRFKRVFQDVTSPKKSIIVEKSTGNGDNVKVQFSSGSEQTNMSRFPKDATLEYWEVSEDFVFFSKLELEILIYNFPLILLSGLLITYGVSLRFENHEDIYPSMKLEGYNRTSNKDEEEGRTLDDKIITGFLGLPCPRYWEQQKISNTSLPYFISYLNFSKNLPEGAVDKSFLVKGYFEIWERFNKALFE